TSSANTGNQWYKDGVKITGETNATYTISQPGLYSVTVSNIGNCSASSVATSVSVFPNPIAYAGPDLLVHELDSARLQGSATVGTVFSYLWTPSIYLSNDTIAQPLVVRPKIDGYYTLYVTNENGCTNSDEVFVKVQKELIIPNAFSPNGDKINDTWEITGLDTYPFCTVEIFARSGQIIYKSFGYSKPWDGTYNGKPVPVGVYYYIINPKSGRGIRSGNVTLLR
ncbi:MAG: gliding motility-associated C-terminal domain-containing protein, partial [Chitinophagaceae bacterium]|nr:gliding motility-associated C-terminal domain-containing protein [Chitinophagaceae bacterium]